MTDVLIASVYMSVPAWMDEEIARPVTEEGLHRQIEKAGAKVVGEVLWSSEIHVLEGEEFVVMAGLLYGIRRADEEETQ